MAKFTCSLSKKSSNKKLLKLHQASGPLVGFDIQDNGDLTFTVYGKDAAGNGGIDISGVATLAVVSDDLTVLTIDPPVGMTSAVHTPTSPAPVPGSATIEHLTATWNDGSVGPFVIDWPFTITAGGPTGIMVVPGTPTVH